MEQYNDEKELEKNIQREPSFFRPFSDVGGDQDKEDGEHTQRAARQTRKRSPDPFLKVIRYCTMNMWKLPYGIFRKSLYCILSVNTIE